MKIVVLSKSCSCINITHQIAKSSNCYVPFQRNVRCLLNHIKKSMKTRNKHTNTCILPVSRSNVTSGRIGCPRRIAQCSRICDQCLSPLRKYDHTRKTSRRACPICPRCPPLVNRSLNRPRNSSLRRSKPQQHRCRRATAPNRPGGF